MKIECVSRSKSLYPLILKDIPENTNFLALGENLCMLGLRLVAQKRQPKVLR